MELQFIVKNNKIGIIFKDVGRISNILFLGLESVKNMINQIESTLTDSNDDISVFEDKSFSFIKKVLYYILSIYVTDSFATGVYLTYKDMRIMEAQLNRLKSQLTLEEVDNG